ncbi:MAG: hypothetical protein IID40_08225, partial [Planctomycetes bacterium]|nr:hypothetical protein [Planctomycetota bacterium]
MQRYPGRNRWRWLIVVAASGLSACAPTGGGGGGDENGANGGGGGGIGGGGGPIPGGFDEGGLPEPEALPADVANIPPTGRLLIPAAEGEFGIGDVVFLWEATDANGTTLDNTVYVSDQAAVFDEPVVIQGVRSSPDETEHRLSIQFPEAGPFFWGVEISDGVNTTRVPADGQGLPFAVSASSIIIVGLEDAILVCPGSALPARSVTTFHWSLGDALPTRTEIFVSRSGVANPFVESLRVFLVDPPTDTSYALTEADALTIGDELSWGLRIQTADEVLFTFEGQTGESFTVAENVPPSGQLL